MSLNELFHKVASSSITAVDIAPSVGDLIDFNTPADYVVRGAMVTKREYFCNEWNYFVEYTFQGYDGRLYETTGWVAGRDVL